LGGKEDRIVTFFSFRHPLGTMLVLLIAVVTLASPAQARHEWQAFGGGGDATNKIECPSGQVMVGLEGRTGDWVNTMRILCAPLTGPFATGAVQPVGGYFGGRPGGGASDARCPSNSVLNSFDFNLSPDKGKVVRVELNCIQANGEVFRATFGNYNAPDEGCGKALGFLPKGCDPGEGDRVQNCPQEQFVGLTVRSGKDVNAVGVICDWRAAPAPVKPIKTTGRAKTTSSKPAVATGPPLALRASISGPWKVTAGEERYNLVLNAAGNGFMPGQGDTLPFPVAGTLTGDDGSPDTTGTFSANMLATRQLQGGYGQKNGKSGQCLLNYAADGQSLVGDCSRGKESVRWTATRGSWPVSPSKRVDRAALHTVEVKLDVDVYAASGGNGQPIAELGAGTADVALVEACKNDWCHVRWGDKEGWVYSGADYNALGR
jgi:hypothetical protein